MIVKLGMDVHAAKLAICVQVDGETPRPAQLVTSEREPAGLPHCGIAIRVRGW
ncbi:MAG TPA: hypothetical protein VGF85_07115 [Opitutaceae bacterium]